MSEKDVKNLIQENLFFAWKKKHFRIASEKGMILFRFEKLIHRE